MLFRCNAQQTVARAASSTTAATSSAASTTAPVATSSAASTTAPAATTTGAYTLSAASFSATPSNTTVSSTVSGVDSSVSGSSQSSGSASFARNLAAAFSNTGARPKVRFLFGLDIFFKLNYWLFFYFLLFFGRTGYITGIGYVAFSTANFRQLSAPATFMNFVSFRWESRVLRKKK